MMGRVSLVALNPIGAIAASGNEAWYGTHIPSWLLGLAINGGLGLLACALAVHRLEDEAVRRTLALRCYLFGYLIALLVLIGGSNFGVLVGGGGGADHLTLLGIIGLAALVLFLPVLATGDARDLDPPYGAVRYRWLTFDIRDAFRMASLRAVFPSAVATVVLGAVGMLICCKIWEKYVPNGLHFPVSYLGAPLTAALALLISGAVFIAGMDCFFQFCSETVGERCA